ITMGKAPGVELFVGGFGSLEERLEKICGENVTLLGPVPPRDVSALSHQADVLIALYDPSYLNNRLGAPNKLFEAMLYGKPLLVAKGSWAGEVVEKEEIGLAVEFEGGGVFQALTRLRKDEELCARMSARGLEAARDRYNWPMMEKRLLDIYRSLLKEGKKGM
ncbi:MAG: glycosyltransferase, partial [Thermoplasmata archaeon]|nr:glycosyltransferase [Thermoplasmata archaeon]